MVWIAGLVLIVGLIWLAIIFPWLWIVYVVFLAGWYIVGWYISEKIN